MDERNVGPNDGERAEIDQSLQEEISQLVNSLGRIEHPVEHHGTDSESGEDAVMRVYSGTLWKHTYRANGHDEALYVTTVEPSPPLDIIHLLVVSKYPTVDDVDDLQYMFLSMERVDDVMTVAIHDQTGLYLL